MRHLLDGLPDAAAVLAPDGTAMYVNARLAAMFGYEVGALEGQPIDHFLAPARLETQSDLLIRRIVNGERVALDTVRVRADDVELDVELTATPLADPAGQWAACLFYRDLTAEKRAARTVRQLMKAVETMQTGVTITDIEGKIIYSNPADARLHGWDPRALVGQDVSVFAPGGSRQPLSVDQLREVTSWEREVVNVRKDGSTFLSSLLSDVVRDETGEPVAIVTTCEDITERKRAEERLIHDAFHDNLTALPNRAMFTSMLERAIARMSRRGQRPYALLFLDLDRFKVVNDSLGHAAGDRLLCEVAERLHQCVRPGDAVARLGGDEFTLLLDEIDDPSGATRVAKRVIKAIEDKFVIDGHELYISTSIGIAIGSPSYRDPEQALRDADIAMYRAKSRGLGRYELFDETMHEKAVRLLELETGIRRALADSEFRVHYQPIVSFRTHRIVGFEALLRWQHPDRGLLLPNEFVHVAEETGFIVHIGWWVLEESVRQIKTWQTRFPTEPPLCMSVNLAPVQFQQADLVDRLLGLIARYKLPAHSLKIEITESALMRSAEANVEVLDSLVRNGIQVLVDDFGTGYSSLSYLRQFRVSTLKIDRSFVSSLQEREESLEIVRTIVALARALQLTVIAEGVETADEHHQLSLLDCDEMQGFYFSHAVEPKDVERLLAKHNV